MNGIIPGRENGVCEGRFNGICGKSTDVKVSFGAAVGFGFVQVGSVTVDLEAHVNVVKTYGVIGVSGTVIEKLGDAL